MRLSLALISLLVVASFAVPAHADTPPQALALCQGSPPRGCSITLADTTREGATFPVTVVGNPQTRVTVMAYQAIVEDGSLTQLIPLGRGTEVITGTSGAVTTDLEIPVAADQPSSGWLLVSLNGVQGTDIAHTVGSFVPFGSRQPMLLGDGYSQRKPVGQTLTLALVGAIPGTRFAVEYADDQGRWHDITVPGGAVAADPSQTSTVNYQLPRGLTGTAKPMRLRNLSDTSLSSQFEAIPDAVGTPEASEPIWNPPPVGQSVDTAQPPRGYPRSALCWTALGLGLVALVTAGCLGWVNGTRWRIR